jgi:adenylate kinase
MVNIIMTKIGITGNPGVGKHTISKLLSKKMDLAIVDINNIIISNNAFIKKNDLKIDVDIQKLRQLVRNELLKKK